MKDPLDLRKLRSGRTDWSVDSILPEGFLPMLPTAVTGPVDDEDYALEVRWEGYRVLVGMEGPLLRVRTATGQDGSGWFPELQAARRAAEPHWVLLDGELVAEQNGLPSPTALRQRIARGGAGVAADRAGETPVHFLVYDILRIGNAWLTDVAWEDRREILERTVHAVPGVRLSTVYSDSRDAQARAREMGLEGLVARRRRGRYCPGERTRDWLTLRPLETVNASICGWLDGRGVRAGSLGALLLGIHRNGELAYVGHTGTGLDTQTLQSLHGRLQELAQPDCPFRIAPELRSTAHWVRPRLSCRIRHQGWTETGLLRLPMFMELLPEGLELRPAGSRLGLD